jgi:hypothetical protein
MKTMIVYSALIGLLMSPLIQAKEIEDKYPTGCRNVGYEYELKTVIFKPALKQSMYFIYNQLEHPVSLYQMLSDHSAQSLFMNHTVKPKQWTVLSSSANRMNYVCTIPDSKSKYGRIVDCATSLKVCEFTNVKYGLNNRGNYWMVQSNTKNGALREVVHYGIIPAQ